MKQNLSKIYTFAVIIALVVLGGWSAWDIYQLRSSNSEAAQINVEQIKTQVEKSYNSGVSFSDETFFQMIRKLFRDNPDLEILTVYSHDAEVGIEYHYNRGEDVQLLNLSETTPINMKNLPEYKYNQLLKTKLSSPLRAQEQTGLVLDLIYKVVDRTTIYNILIRLLIVVVVLFFTTLFMIFTVSRKNVEEEDVEEESASFDDDEEMEDDLSLDWDESAAPSEEKDDLSLDDDAFSDLDLNDTGGDFADLDLGSDSDDLSFDDVTDDFSTDTSDDLSFDGLSDDLSADSSDDLNFDDLSDELSLEEPSDDLSLGDDMNEEFSMDEISDDFNLDEGTDDLGDLNLGEDTQDFGDLDLGEDTTDDLGDLDLGEDTTDDLGDLNLGDDTTDDLGDLDFGDMDLDSDIPAEEDLMAMDHEVSPTSSMDDDIDFDSIEDTFDESPSLYSPKSGVGWESFIEERVNLELERAAAEDQDLVMGLVQCDSLTEDNYKIFADQLKEDFNYPDMIFEYKDKGFALIVPHNDLDGAIKTLEAFTGKEQSQYGEINVGISSRNGRLITGSRIFMEAENALHKAVDDVEKNIVGFRSDPDKFRDFLSNK